MNNNFICPNCKNTLLFKSKLVQCVSCGREFSDSFGILKLLPTKLEKNKINEDKLNFDPACDVYKYNKQVWRCLIDLSFHLQRFEKEILPLFKGKKKILELACGNGWASALTKLSLPNSTVYASDVSPSVLELKAKKLFNIMQAKVDFIVAADAENLPFDDGSLDCVFVIASLHHFPNTSKVLKEVKRVLTKGGIFVGIDGTMPEKFRRLILGPEGKIKRAENFGILEQLFTYKDWLDMLKEAGFSKSSLTPYLNPDYMQSANNEDEAKIMRFSLIRELLFKGVINRLPKKIIEWLCLLDLLPVGVIIYYKKE